MRYSEQFMEHIEYAFSTVLVLVCMIVRGHSLSAVVEQDKKDMVGSWRRVYGEITPGMLNRPSRMWKGWQKTYREPVHPIWMTHGA